jgi:Immunity protein 27
MDTPLPLQPDETVLNGQLLVVNNCLIGDATQQRIDWLIEYNLTSLTLRQPESPCASLYQDDTDMRFWELSYPQPIPGKHFSGPKQLRNLKSKEMIDKYNLYMHPFRRPRE